MIIPPANISRIRCIHCLLIAVFFTGLFLPLRAISQNIAINEIMASNASTISDMDGDFSDWIELYNYGEAAVDLKGWGLSDNYEEPFRWIFPKRIIKPGEYLLVWASGKDRRPDSESMTQGLMREVYAGISGTRIVNLTNHSSYPENPTSTGIISKLFEAPTDVGDNYGQRMHGWIKAPSTGLYTFWISGDDECHLYLSNGESREDISLIARVPEWTFPREWFKYPEQQSAEILLKEGEFYYVKALMKEAGGGDCLAVGWKLPGGQTEMPIQGKHLYWTEAELHTNFAISASGEEVLLTSPSGEMADEITPRVIPKDISLGRFPDGTGELMFFSNPSPGASNNTGGYNEILSPPVFSHLAGFYKEPFQLAISHDDPDVNIIYTIDGSEPLPGNLMGTSFRYKNSYPQATHSSPGPMLQSSYKSLKYTGPIAIHDRTADMEVLAQMSSTFHREPTYLPTKRIFKGYTIRAVAFKEGALPSREVTRSYFFSPSPDQRFSLPVISISIQPDHLFGYDNGIYVAGKIFDNWRSSNPSTGVTGGSNANYHQAGEDWEYPAHMELFEWDTPHPALSQHIGIRIHGGWTRALPMKSLRLYARSEYGESKFNHKMFPDQHDESYNRLILRNSGNDFPNTMFRDAVIQAMVSHLNFDVLAYRPLIVFINGEYWGIHNLRERYDKHYLNRVYGVDPEKIDLLNYVHGLGIDIREGDNAHYNAMVSYINANNLANDQHYQHIQTLMDVESFTDYNITNIFVYNHDWPGNNTELWRLKTTSYQADAPTGHDGRWRWLLFDTDYGLGWWNNDVRHNTLAFATEAGRSGWPNPDFSTLLLRNLLKNQSYRNYFISRYADLLNTTFLPGRTTSIINRMKAVIEPEMEEHITRWSMPESMDKWHEEVQVMIDFVNARPVFQRQHMRRQFGITGNTTITTDVSAPEHGHIRINTIDIMSATEGISADPYPWTGIYFQGIPVTFEAIPKPGYAFSHWEGLDERFTQKTSQTFNAASVAVTAHFVQSEVLHYWHFNTLATGSITGIAADQSLLDGGFISYPGTGSGFMDRVADGSSLNALSDATDGYALRVRNPSDTRELIIRAPTTAYRGITLSYVTKRTNNGARTQALQYRSSEKESWISHPQTYEISEEWERQQWTLPDDVAKDKPDLTIKIHFPDEYASATSGNNRFDNVRIEGLAIQPDDGQVSAKPISEDTEKMSCWHHLGNLYLENHFRGESTLTIINVSGRTMATYHVPGPGNHTFPFAAGPGIYIVQLLSKNGISTARIMVR